jgi:phospholipid/cholesterol/gamma-HCH transport system substrate-binding protein
MTNGTRRGLRAIGIVCLIGTVLAAVTFFVFAPGGRNRFTAYLSAAVGLYTGSTVRVLGVSVGEVEAVVPVGRQVRVELSVDDDVPIPRDAMVAVVSPSLVSDRYVQFTPAYTRGPRLVDGAVIPRDRTVVPAELDELFASLDELATALGPDGANADGAFSDLLDTLAANAKGNGELINQTITQLAEANRALSGAREELFDTVTELQEFTGMLAGNDDQLVGFVTQLADVSRFLSGERDDIGGAITELGTALESVRGFIQDNRAAIKSNVDDLVGITDVLVRQRNSLAEALDTAPNAVRNFEQIYDPSTNSLDARALLLEWFPGSTAAPKPAAAPDLPLPPVGPGYSTGGG